MSNGDDIYGGFDDAPEIQVDVHRNTEQRLPCILLIDCSGSMSVGGKIEQVNQGLLEFENALKSDSLASLRAVIAVIAFGTPQGVELIQDWTDAIDFTAPQFEAHGLTPMGEAVDAGLDAIESMRHHLKANGITMYRPWLFLFTDGMPTDDYKAAAARCAREAKEQRILFWPMTTDPDNAEALREFAGPKGNVFGIDSTMVRELFVWLSDSVKTASSSKPGDRFQVEAPGTILSFDL